MARSARCGEDGVDQNDFLGSIDIPVQNLPAAGSDKWYKLEGKIVADIGIFEKCGQKTWHFAE